MSHASGRTMRTAFAVAGMLAIFQPLQAAAQSLPSGQRLVDHGFEPGTLLHPYARAADNPWIPGEWNAESADILTDPVNGVIPFERNGMLRINRIGGVTSQVCQIVDVTPWATRIDAGDAIMVISGWANAASPDVSPGIEARAGESLTKVGTINLVGGVQINGFNRVLATAPLDADPASWQRINGSLALPATTRFIHFELFEGNVAIPTEGFFFDTVVLSLRTSCPCDWNDSGNVDSQDFFDFLNDFFVDDADLNADGPTNTQDFIDFLACFFAEC